MQTRWRKWVTRTSLRLCRAGHSHFLSLHESRLGLSWASVQRGTEDWMGLTQLCAGESTFLHVYPAIPSSALAT